MSNTINGITFEKMMLNALNNLYNHEKEINDMNVFPVADGDTGTNMRLTLENGINHASKDKHLGNYLKNLSTGMLLGARGNSGVILSQLFKGMYSELKSDSIVNPGEMRDALIKGYQTAYKAVLKPVEGTILTVAREGIENIKNQIKGRISQEETFKIYVNELNKQLKLTPNILPILKEANVLDSGAKGYVVIVEGMYKYLLGQIIERDYIQTRDDNEKTKLNNEEDDYIFDLSIKINIDTFDIKVFDKKLKILSVEYEYSIDNDIVNVKAKANDPAKCIRMIKEFGDVVSLKLENSSLTSKEEKQEEIPFKAIVYISCVSGSGVANLYKDMGVDVLLNMNPSTQDFLDAFKRINAERIVILPNDKNIVETAYQAMKLSRLDNITILSTKNVIEGYYSLAMDVPDSSVNNRISAISENVGVICLNVSKAIKEYANETLKVNVGEFVTYIDGKILASDKDIIASLDKTLKQVEDIDSKSSVFILLGKEASNDLEDELNDFFSDYYDHLEVNILAGDQDKEIIALGIL